MEEVAIRVEVVDGPASSAWEVLISCCTKELPIQASCSQVNGGVSLGSASEAIFEDQNTCRGQENRDSCFHTTYTACADDLTAHAHRVVRFCTIYAPSRKLKMGPRINARISTTQWLTSIATAYNSRFLTS